MWPSWTLSSHPTPKEKEKKTTTIYKILAIRLQLPMKKNPYK